MLIRHSALYALGKLAPGLLGMATTALLTRLLDPAAYGLYGLALVVMTFGSTLAFDWLGLAYLRVAQGAPDAFGTVAGLFAALLLAIAIGAGFAWAGGAFEGPAGAAVAAGLLLMVCYATFELAARLPVARFQPMRFLVMNGVRAVFSLLGAAGAAGLTRDPAWTACGAAFGTATGVLFAGARLAWPRFDPALARKLLLFGLPLAASMALASLAGSGVRGLLEALGSAEALGLYTAAFLLVQNTLAVVAAGIASAGYPAAVRALEHGDTDGARQQVASNWALLVTVLAPMALGMALTAPGIAATLVGPRYVAGVAALTPWLAAAGFFAAVRAQGLDHVFQLAHRPGRLACVTAVAATIAVGLTVLLVPHFGPQGAAMASCAAALASCGLALAWGQRIWPVPPPLGTAARVVTACVVMAVAVRAAPGGLAGQVLAGAVSYLAAAVTLDVLGVRGRLGRGGMAWLHGLQGSIRARRSVLAVGSRIAELILGRCSLRAFKRTTSTASRIDGRLAAAEADDLRPTPARCVRPA